MIASCSRERKTARGVRKKIRGRKVEGLETPIYCEHLGYTAILLPLPYGLALPVCCVHLDIRESPQTLSSSIPLFKNQDMSYQVSLVSFAGAPRDHHVIFVQTDQGGSGQIFHIKGRIQQGMTYETKPARNPEESTTFIARELLGTVTIENYSRIDSVCKQVPPPAKQLDLAHRINPSVPLRQCQEWTQETIQALKNEGILQ